MKERYTTFKESHPYYHRSNGGTPSFKYNQRFEGYDEVHSNGNRGYQDLGKTNQDIGGSFLSIQREYSESGVVVRKWYPRTNPSGGNSWHDCGLYPYDDVITAGDFPPASIMSPMQLAALGTTAISRCAPTNPLSGLATALGELREGLPKMVGHTALKGGKFSQNIGSEYLNYQFGILPTISDVRRTWDTVQRADKLTKQYEKNAGKKIKRKYSFPEEISSVTTVDGARRTWRPTNVGVNYFLNSDMYLKLKKTVITRRKVWFKGAFTYYLPPSGTLAHKEKVANYLYGTRLTPSVAWELTPWSWAIDWVTNLGDVINNVSLFLMDGLIMPYGYIMCETHVTYIYEAEDYYSTGRRPASLLGSIYRPEQRLTTIVRQRMPATPFGFGFDMDSLTTRQLAIIAALGMSRNGSNYKYRGE